MATQKFTKQQIMKRAGWTEQQYKREYAKFSAKVRNLNRLAGTHYNASNELYYSLLEPENATIQSIKEMSSARKGTTQNMREVTYEYMRERWRGLIRDNEQIREQFEKIGTKQMTSTGKMRKYTVKQFNAFAKRYAKKLDKARNKNAMAGSDERIEELEKYYDTETERTIIYENDNILDIFE